jgi:hypothetical protein
MGLIAALAGVVGAQKSLLGPAVGGGCGAGATVGHFRQNGQGQRPVLRTGGIGILEKARSEKSGPQDGHENNHGAPSAYIASHHGTVIACGVRRVNEKESGTSLAETRAQDKTLV